MHWLWVTVGLAHFCGSCNSRDSSLALAAGALCLCCFLSQLWESLATHAVGEVVSLSMGCLGKTLCDVSVFLFCFCCNYSLTLLGWAGRGGGVGAGIEAQAVVSLLLDSSEERMVYPK